MSNSAGCSYCKVPSSIKLKCSLYLKGEYDQFSEARKEYYKVPYTQNVFTNKEIRYCPMCR